jgi:hypothetical protein
MARELAELAIKICIYIAEWFNERKKEKKGDSDNDCRGTSETK